MDLGDLGDADCVLEAQKGDSAALAEIVHRYTPGLFNLFARVLGDREDARDATQEVFLRVQRHLARYNPARSFKTWIFTIAWNLARDCLRRRRRRPRDSRILSLDAHLQAVEERGDRAGIAGRTERRPEERLLERERAEWLREGLDRLPPAQRALLVLREFEDLSHEDLAELLRVPIGTVKSRLHRARCELKEVLMALRPSWIGDVLGTERRKKGLGQ
jgi:RNA polymerase sigma-70 factor (ECF subfamily)